MVNNLKLWGMVGKTDPANTKQAKKGQYSFTAIAPMSQFKEATKAFGIQGIKWGIKIGSEVFHEKAIGETILLNYDAILYFEFEGEKGELSIHATEKLCYKTQGSSGYLKIDDEARKKVVTNAKTKGLSELGFNADIFMGEFDNHEYVELRKTEVKLDNAENFSEEQAKQIVLFKEWFNKQVKTVGQVPNKAAIALVVKNVETTLKDKLKVIKASGGFIDNHIKKLYAAADAQCKHLDEAQQRKIDSQGEK